MFMLPIALMLGKCRECDDAGAMIWIIWSPIGVMGAIREVGSCSTH